MPSYPHPPTPAAQREQLRPEATWAGVQVTEATPTTQTPRDWDSGPGTMWSLGPCFLLLPAARRPGQRNREFISLLEKLMNRSKIQTGCFPLPGQASLSLAAHQSPGFPSNVQRQPGPPLCSAAYSFLGAPAGGAHTARPSAAVPGVGKPAEAQDSVWGQGRKERVVSPGHGGEEGKSHLLSICPHQARNLAERRGL